MLNSKVAEDGHAAFTAFEAGYEEFLNAVSSENPYGYGKCFRYLKDVRRHAGKLSETLKRTGRPSRFLESALVAYDYADALAVQALSLADADRQARICAAAMEVVREAVQYEFLNDILAIAATACQSLQESVVH